MELGEIREEIDKTDREILGLLKKRLELGIEAGRQKRQLGLTLQDPAREETVIETRKAWGKSAGLEEAFVGALYRAIIDETLRRQFGLTNIDTQN